MSLQTQIKQKFNVEARISTGMPGDLNVFVNGINVFAYKKEGQIPAAEDLIARIQSCAAES